MPVNPGSGFGFGTPPSGGKAKDAASPESEKKPELPAAETKPAAAGGFNFGGGASATSASPFASAAATNASPFASAAKPAAGGLDFGGTTTAAPAKAVETASPPAPAAGRPGAASGRRAGRLRASLFPARTPKPSARAETREPEARTPRRPRGRKDRPARRGARRGRAPVATPVPAAPPSTPSATPLVDSASDAHVQHGFELLEAVKAGALDMASAQKQLKDLMVSGTPPPPTPPAAKDASAAKAKSNALDVHAEASPMPAGFSPRRVAESPGAFGKDPTPTWGQKLAAARAASAAAPAVTTPRAATPAPPACAR